MLPEEHLVHRFNQDVKTKLTSVQCHSRVSHPRRRHARIPKKSGSEVLRQITGILTGIVEHDFAEPKEFLPRHKFVEFHRKARLVIERSKTAASLEPDGDLFEYFIVYRDRRLNVRTILAPQFFQLRFGNFNFEMPDHRAGEKLIRHRGTVKWRADHDGAE